MMYFYVRFQNDWRSGKALLLCSVDHWGIVKSLSCNSYPSKHQNSVPCHATKFYTPRPSDLHSSNVPFVWIQPIHQIYALLIHREDNSSTQNQSSEPRHCTTPESQEALVLCYHGCTCVAIPIELLRFYALHPGLDCVDWLSHIHCYQPGHSSNAKCRHGTEFLPW